MAYCISCGAAIDESGRFCPECGTEQPLEAKDRNRSEPAAGSDSASPGHREEFVIRGLKNRPTGPIFNQAATPAHRHKHLVYTHSRRRAVLPFGSAVRKKGKTPPKGPKPSGEIRHFGETDREQDDRE
ncbi:MAG: zinc ribbon domain-containing protein [Clostridia bacterium]|nr:zinc ribbon domain-containing protein [Clostridia bacterium]